MTSFRPYYDYPSRGNLLCCLPDCGVPRKLLCVKNGKFVRHPRECLKVWNGNRCNSSCCDFKCDGKGKGKDRFQDRLWWRRCEYGNCGNRGCCGRFNGWDF